MVEKNLGLVLDSAEGKRLVQAELDQVRDKAGPIDFVAFDTMWRMHHGDENDSTTIIGLWQVIDRIHRRYNCATMFTHHTVKPPRDPAASFDPTDPFIGRGSGDIYGGGDAFVVVVPGKGNEDSRQLSLYFESKRGKPLFPARLKVHFGTGAVEYMGQAWDKHEEQEVNI